MALQLTQHLTEMSTTKVSWGVKAADAYDRQSYHLHVPIVMKSGSLNLLESFGPVKVCNGIALPLTVPIPIRLFIYTVQVIMVHNSVLPYRNVKQSSKAIKGYIMGCLEEYLGLRGTK
jgi:hypothetical protein